MPALPHPSAAIHYPLLRLVCPLSTLHSPLSTIPFPIAHLLRYHTKTMRPSMKRRYAEPLVAFFLSFVLGGVSSVWAQPKPGKKPPPTQTPEQKAELQSKSGQEEFLKGNYDAALKLFLEAANLDPKTTDYLFNAGLCHSKLGESNAKIKNNAKAVEDYQAAIDIFQSLLVKIPDNNKELRGRVEKSLVAANQKQAEIKFSTDQDQDGIANELDLCPNEAGTALTKGCPDEDKDAVSDKDDECPKEAGPGAAKGCPDQDGDLIADKDDACPAVAGILETKGCAKMTGPIAGPEKPTKEPSEKKIHKVLFAGAGVLGAGSLALGTVGFLQIKAGNNEIANQQFDTFAGKFEKGLLFGHIADGLAVGAVVCAGVGLVTRPKKTPEKTSLVISPNSIGVAGSF
jgi:tetratricopeptide (TPR) repeat protein